MSCTLIWYAGMAILMASTWDFSAEMLRPSSSHLVVMRFSVRPAPLRWLPRSLTTREKVVRVAKQHCVLLEGEGNQLLHQRVEKEPAEDVTLGRPVLELAETGLVALELYPGEAVLGVVAEPGEQFFSNPRPARATRMTWGLASSNVFFQVEEDCACGAVVDLRQEGDDAVRCT